MKLETHDLRRAARSTGRAHDHAAAREPLGRPIGHCGRRSVAVVMENTLLRIRRSYLSDETGRRNVRSLDARGTRGGTMGRMTKADDNARYQELLEVAPAESLELVHEEAFGKLTAAERDEMFDGAHRLGGHTRARSRPMRHPPRSPPRQRARRTSRPGALGRLFGRNDETDPSSALFAVFVAYAIGSELSFGLLTAAPFRDGADDGPRTSAAASTRTAASTAGSDARLPEREGVRLGAGREERDLEWCARAPRPPRGSAGRAGRRPASRCRRRRRRCRARSPGGSPSMSTRNGIGRVRRAGEHEVHVARLEPERDAASRLLERDVLVLGRPLARRATSSSGRCSGERTSSARRSGVVANRSAAEPR